MHYAITMAASDANNTEKSLDFRRNYVDQHQVHRHETQDGQPPRFNFSPEEMRALKECNRESFYQRSLPFSATAMFAAHFAVKAGYLSSSPKYGSLWKVLVAGSVGYFMGKISYREKCAEKLMRIPNSKLGEALRRRKRGLPADQDAYAFEQSFFGGVNEAESPVVDRSQEADAGSGLWEIDDDRNIKFQGLDDSQRPNPDSEFVTSSSSEEQKPQVYTTYDALRQQNRDEYEMRRFNMKKDPQSAARRPVAPSPPPAPSSSAGTSTNQYGDSLE